MIKIQDGSSARPSMFLDISTKLFMVFGDIAYKCDVKGYAPVITSIIRKQTTDSGVHALGRAIDFILMFKSGGFAPYDKFHDDLIEYVNKAYPYDPKRPEMVTIMWHSVKEFGGKFHFHLQTQV